MAVGTIDCRLAKHQLSTLPQVLDLISTDRVSENGKFLVNVAVRCAFDLLVSRTTPCT